jgi:hypothetical protein
MVFTAPIFVKFALAQIVANIPVPNSFQIGRKMDKIRAKLCFLAEVSYGFILHRFSRNRQPQNGTTEDYSLSKFTRIDPEIWKMRVKIHVQPYVERASSSPCCETRLYRIWVLNFMKIQRTV